MTLDLQSLLSAMPSIVAVAKAVPQFKTIFGEWVETFGASDQDILKHRYAELMDQNDADHARRQAG